MNGLTDQELDKIKNSLDTETGDGAVYIQMLRSTVNEIERLQTVARIAKSVLKDESYVIGAVQRRGGDVTMFGAAILWLLERADENDELRKQVADLCPIGALDALTTWQTEKQAMLEEIEHLHDKFREILHGPIGMTYGREYVKELEKIAREALNE